MMERQEDRDKTKATLVLSTIFRTIMTLLTQKISMELDLGIIGKITVFDRTVIHEPYTILKRTTVDGSKIVVSPLLSEKENTQKLRKTDSLPQLMAVGTPKMDNSHL
jgi:hypothetical protein